MVDGRALEEAGKFLVGDPSTHTGWLQTSLSSISTQGDFLCLARGQNFLLYRSSWTLGRFELKEIHRDTVSVLQEDEEITSLVVFPVLSEGRVQSISHFTALGFNSGLVRVYTETGQLIVEKCFHPSPVRHIKFQSLPEGKHCSNILYTQTIQEMLVVYESVVVSIDAGDLLATIHKNVGELASTLARGLETTHLLSLKGHKLLIKDQTVEDCESFVFTNPSYNQYFQLTMQGGIVDDRHKPVSTKPYFLTIGQEPFLQYNEKGHISSTAGELAHNMVSTVKSGFFRVASGALGSIWSSSSPPDPKEPLPDPQSNLSISHSIKDPGRQGTEVLISPNKTYSAVKDSQNRILLVDNYSRTVLQMWRGYHRCQMGWALASSEKLTNATETHTLQDVATVLILYLPRRGLIEVWSPEQKVKVVEFHVSKHGTLLRSAGVCLDDGLPRRRDTVRIFTVFLHPQGRISHFYIPFHALSISSTAEKDINTQSRVLQLIQDRSERFLEEAVKLLEEIRNAQLKNMTIWKILTSEDNPLSPGEGLSLVDGLVKAALQSERSQALEQKLYLSRLTKLNQLLVLFSSNPAGTEDVQVGDGVSKLDLAAALSVPDCEVDVLLKLVTPAADEPEPRILCSDFLQCFDIEGELTSGEKTVVRLKKDISPRLQSQLSKLFRGIAFGEDGKQVLFNSGISTAEILETAVLAFLRRPGHSVQAYLHLNRCFLVLLGIRDGSDDRTVTVLQDVCKRILLKSTINLDLYALIFLWMNALCRAESPPSYIDDWSRRLHQVSSFVEITRTFQTLVGEDLLLRYTLNDVFDSGNGRLAEIMGKWLHRLGSNSLNISSDIDGFKDTKELALVSKCAEFFPSSMDNNIILVHMSWEELQRWQADKNNVQLLETALLGLTSISCSTLRLKFSNLIWRSFFSKLFRDIAKRTDDFRKSTLNESTICEKEFGLRRDNVASLLSLLLAFIEKTLDLVRSGDTLEITAEYDSFSMSKQQHLLDHIKNTGLPDTDIVSLEQQVASVLFLTWQLKLPSRPLKLFNSVEVNNLLSIQSMAVVSWFSDYNASVKKERLAWMEVVAETAAGYIHRLPDNQLDIEDYKKYMDIALQLGRLWFISEDVRMHQCQALYKTGFDSLGSDVRGGTADAGRLAEKLLEVALLRIAKYLHQDCDAGRTSAIPSDVVTEVAARRAKAGSVADTSLAETLALLLWLTEALEIQELQILSTQCVNAVQVLQVRRSRLGE